jgi:glycosidase
MIIPVSFELLFSPRDRDLLEETHAHVTESYNHLQSRHSPHWTQGMTLYEIFVRNYSKEGTLKKVLHDLPRLHDLGVKAIWLMPIHPIGQHGRKGSHGSPYSIRDYLSINPDLGNPDDLRELVKAVHKLDMRILMDLVANHTANDHVEMKNHPDWFWQDSKGSFNRRIADWCDVTDLNYQNPELRNYMKEVILYWVKEYDIDGYRCDVAGLVALDFWSEVRDELEGIKPDIFLLAEGDDPQMHLNAFDATYDWDLYYTFEDVKEGKVKAESAVDVILRAEELFPRYARRLRFIENHDLERSMRLFSGPAYKPYAALIFTVPGIPLIYNGQEVGEAVRPDLFEKEPINWSKADLKVLDFYKSLIHLRQNYDQLSEGKMIKINTDSPNEAAAFARIKNDKVGIVVLNFSKKLIKAKLEFPLELQKKQLKYSFNKDGRIIEGPLLDRANAVTLKPYDIQIFVN